MPENTTNTIKSVQFLRNNQVYADFKTLKDTVLKSDNGAEFINTSVIANSEGQRTLKNIDGTLVLLRYRDKNSVVNTVIATVHSTGTAATLSLDTSYDVLNAEIKEVTGGAVKESDVNDAIAAAISKLGLTYDAANGGKLTIKTDATQESDKTVTLPVDNFLKSAKLDITTNPAKPALVLEFITEENTPAIRVELDSLKDIYAAGDGLTLDGDNKFAVKFKSAGEEDLVKLTANPTDGVTVDTTKLNDKLTALEEADGKFSRTYLTQEAAGNTYLTKTDAESTYMKKIENIDLGTF